MPSQKKCFIICPLGDKGSTVRKRSDDLRSYIIEPVLKSLDIKLERADTLADPGNITTKVIMKINEADIVIADLTDRNPNVFYELAIAHALSKPVIHMSKKGERIPFDVNQYRYVSYDDTDLAELEPTQQELESQLKNIPQNPEEIINPFTEALSMIRISKSGNPTEKIIAELRSTVGMQEARINQLESNQETRHYDELAQRERILESRENLEREIVRTGVELKHLSNKVNKDPDDLKRELYLKNKMEKLQISRTELMYRIHNRDD